MSTYFDEINSEIIWSFGNVKKQLLEKYPNGCCQSEVLRTINGQLWQVDFYPNGKDKQTKGNVDTLITLLTDKEKNRTKINASCHYKLEIEGKNYANHANILENKTFIIDKPIQDSSFPTSLLENCDDGLKVYIGLCELEEEEEIAIETTETFETEIVESSIKEISNSLEPAIESRVSSESFNSQEILDVPAQTIDSLNEAEIKNPNKVIDEFLDTVVNYEKVGSENYTENSYFINKENKDSPIENIDTLVKFDAVDEESEKTKVDELYTSQTEQNLDNFKTFETFDTFDQIGDSEPLKKTGNEETTFQDSTLENLDNFETTEHFETMEIQDSEKTENELILSSSSEQKHLEKNKEVGLIENSIITLRDEIEPQLSNTMTIEKNFRVKTISEISSATPNLIDTDEDFQKITVKPLY